MGLSGHLSLKNLLGSFGLGGRSIGLCLLGRTGDDIITKSIVVGIVENTCLCFCCCLRLGILSSLLCGTFLIVGFLAVQLIYLTGHSHVLIHALQSILHIVVVVILLGNLIQKLCHHIQLVLSQLCVVVAGCLVDDILNYRDIGDILGDDLCLRLVDDSGGFLLAYIVSQLAGDNQLLCGKLFFLRVQFLSAGLLVCHNDSGQCAGSGYPDRCSCDNVTVYNAGSGKGGCDHVAGHPVQVCCLYLDSAGRCRRNQCTAVCVGSDLLQRNIRSQMISLVLVSDRQDIHLIGGHTKIVHYDLFLLVSKISSKGYYLSAVCARAHGNSQCQTKPQSGCAGKFFLHHKTSSLVLS